MEGGLRLAGGSGAFCGLRLGSFTGAVAHVRAEGLEFRLAGGLGLLSLNPKP